MLLPSPARAASGGDELEFGTALDLRDQPLHALWDAPSPTGSLWVAVQASLTERSGKGRDFGALLLVGVPLERLYRSRVAPARPLPSSIADPARLPPTGTTARDAQMPASAPGASTPGASAPQPVPSKEAAASQTAETAAAGTPTPLQQAPRVTPRVAREAVDAALRRAHLKDPDTRLDAIAVRARMASLLPELRLRATRLVDEAQALSPTEYDPERVTASGGVSLWLEARCTWRLDRLVFAGEEMAIERMRHDRAAAALKLSDRVLDLLFAWQQALAQAEDPASSAEQVLKASLKAVEAEATLDVLTGGWFSRWRSQLP